MLKMKKETYKVTSESSQHLQFYSNKSVKKRLILQCASTLYMQMCVSNLWVNSCGNLHTVCIYYVFYNNLLLLIFMPNQQNATFTFIFYLENKGLKWLWTSCFVSSTTSCTEYWKMKIKSLWLHVGGLWIEFFSLLEMFIKSQHSWREFEAKALNQYERDAWVFYYYYYFFFLLISK